MCKSSSRGLVGLLGLVGLGLVAWGAPARAADTPPEQRGGRDQAIVRQLHSQNQDAIAAARIGEERTTRDDVRSYATQVIRDRQASDAKLLAYAQQAGLNMPEIDTGAAALPHGPLATARLTTAPDYRFDGEFAGFMNALSQADEDQSAEAARLAQSQELETLIQSTFLPRLADQQAGATNLTAALPPLPPPGIQHPGDPSTASWTNTGLDTIPPGLAR